jgi:hypothetical protein
VDGRPDRTPDQFLQIVDGVVLVRRLRIESLAPGGARNLGRPPSRPHVH